MDYRFQYSSVAPLNISKIIVKSLNWLFLHRTFVIYFVLNTFFCTIFSNKWLFCTHFIRRITIYFLRFRSLFLVNDTQRKRSPSHSKSIFHRVQCSSSNEIVFHLQSLFNQYFQYYYVAFSKK